MWYNQDRYIKLIKEDSTLLKNYYTEYSMNYFDALPKNKDDIEKMMNWIQFNFDSSYYKKLNFNYNIKYDSVLRKSIIYSFGKDKRDNNLKYTPFNSIRMDSTHQFSIFKLSIFKYIFNTSNHDIILVSLNEPVFKCEKLTNRETLDENRVSQFELFKGAKSFFGDKKYFTLFLKQLNNFEEEFNASILKPNKLNILFFMYKNGKIEVVCDDNLSLNKVENIKIKLRDYFKKQDTDYFDYALFALRLKDDNRP